MSCLACGETVFAAEAIRTEKGVWHTSCFTCCTCGVRLTLTTFLTSSFGGGSGHEIFCKRCAPMSKPTVDADAVDFQRVKNRPRVGVVNEQVRGELAGKVSLSGFSSHIHVSGAARRASRDLEGLQMTASAGPLSSASGQRDDALAAGSFSPSRSLAGGVGGSSGAVSSGQPGSASDLERIRGRLRATAIQEEMTSAGSHGEQAFESPFQRMRRPQMPWSGPSGGRNRDALALLSADLIAMKERPEHSDLAFSVSDGDTKEAFFSHRIIVAHRCPLLLERVDDGVITIENCHPSVFKGFLNYIYSGQVA